MKDVVFITGNQKKADYLAKLLGYPMRHHDVDLDEIQAADLHKIVEHKVSQAYSIVQEPVLVEDVGLDFSALKGMPGPFMKFFLDLTGTEAMCRMLDGFDDRSATARCCFGYYDGQNMTFFDGELKGSIAMRPRGSGGYGWDSIFEPDGFDDRTSAELSKGEYDKFYAAIKPMTELRQFLEGRG